MRLKLRHRVHVAQPPQPPPSGRSTTKELIRPPPEALRWDPQPVADASEWVAAVAALSAAGVVGWQSIETRRSANASEKAVDAAERAVVAANDGLELSRRQVAEAVRARIDANMPQITVLAPEYPVWPPSIRWEPARSAEDDRAEFFLPQDARTAIAVRARVTITNDSPTTVEVRALRLVNRRGQVGDHHFTLRPGQQVNVWMIAARSLDEWVAIFRQREGGDPGPLTGGTVFYQDPADTSGTDRWEIVVGGCPVEPVPGRDGSWRLIDRPDDKTGRVGAMRMALAIRERTYWLSKTRGERLEP